MTTFRINGQEYTNNDLCVTIPEEFAGDFEGHEFKDMHEFSMAIGFAGCAAEAKFHGDGRCYRVNTVALRNCLR